MRFFILGLCLKAFAQDSYSEDYNQNPDKYYRDPCPKTRVVGEKNICNALDEYVWRKDENYQWELIETKEKLRNYHTKDNIMYYTRYYTRYLVFSWFPAF